MSKQILLLGGHGKIALLMTPLLLSRSWAVTSVIRNPDQKEEILSRGKDQQGKLDVLVSSLDDVKSDQQAQDIIDLTKPDYVVWSAGSGGKGGASRTFTVDRDAAKHFIAASVRTPTVKKFLMISFTGSRRNRAPWWTDDDWVSCQKVQKVVLPTYYQAKVEADEYLTALAKQRGGDFRAIDLRPGTLTDDDATGKVSLGKIAARGSVTRGDVADVAVRLLEEDVGGWFDLLEGKEDVSEAIMRIITEGIDCVEGEDVNAWIKQHQL